MPDRIATETSPPALHTADQPDCHLSLLPRDLLPALSQLLSAESLRTLALPAAPSLFDALHTYSAQQWANVFFRLFYNRLHELSLSALVNWVFVKPACRNDPSLGAAITKMVLTCNFLSSFVLNSIYLSADTQERLGETIEKWFRIVRACVANLNFQSGLVITKMLQSSELMPLVHGAETSRVVLRAFIEDQKIFRPDDTTADQLIAQAIQNNRRFIPQWSEIYTDLGGMASEGLDMDAERCAGVREVTDVWRAFLSVSHPPPPDATETFLLQLYEHRALCTLPAALQEVIDATASSRNH